MNLPPGCDDMYTSTDGLGSKVPKSSRNRQTVSKSLFSQET